MKNSKFKNALVSVYKKTPQVIKFAKNLTRLGFNIYASSGTAEFLFQNKIEVIDVEKLTGFPAILDHRVVTLHPKIHAGILAKETNENLTQLKKLKIPKFDLVVVDLYPVWNGIKSSDVEKALDLVDIGGPTLLRGAAKNFNNGRIVICDIKDANLVTRQLKREGEVGFETRKKLAAKVFKLMEKYDGAIAEFLENKAKVETLNLKFSQETKLRYGENPHQKASFYQNENSKDSLAIQKFKKIQGKELSFNNFLDIDVAIFALAYLGARKPACVIIKHTNPAGFSIKETISKAYESAWYDGDPQAAFGGIIGVNRKVDKNLAKKILLGRKGEKKFLEILVAPSVDRDALEILSERKDLRVLINPSLKNPSLSKEKDFKKVRGGILYQDPDSLDITQRDLRIVTKTKPTKVQIEDLLLAWKAVKICKSNAICIVKGGVLISSGVGQQDRKESCRIALAKATDINRGKSKSTPVGAVAASDAFFPFSDGPEILIKAGIEAIIQPGGSIRDQETIDLCNHHKVPMVFTQVRSFKH